MLDPTVTHYFPDDSDTTTCGRVMHAADAHATQPTCARCAAALAAEDALDAAIAATPLPLDADEARIALDPVLNAGVPARAPLSPLGADLFALARTLAYLTLLDEVAS